jgi:LPXTG-site transpeptidase (sortase) family protein
MRLPRLLAAVLTAALMCTACGAAKGQASMATGSSAAASGTATAPVRVPRELETFAAPRGVATVPDPVELRITRIGVRTSLERIGREPSGSIGVPRDWHRAGWYTGGARPGQAGPAVILGHVDSPDGPAVFARLRDLRRGDVVAVRRADGSAVKYTVERSQVVQKHDFPTLDVYFPTLRAGLWLVTCDGPYVRGAGGYQANLIVYARLSDRP